MTIELTTDRKPQTPQYSEEQLKEYERYMKLAEDKTVITLLQNLLDEKVLEYTTEYPSTAYTKEMVKLMTYVTTYIQTYNLDLADNEDVKMITEMCRQFMLKMTSHKRRRSHEIVNGASRQEANAQVNMAEHKGLKRFLGIK